MTDPTFQELEDLFCRWTTLRDGRIACGDLRPSERESASFAEYLSRLEALDEDQRAEWNVKRETIECRIALPRCECGHPEALHVEGSCFAMVGCSTACECTRP